MAAIDRHTSALTASDRRNASRDIRRRKINAFILVAPLLAFIIFSFVAPIATMLYRSIYNDTVALLIPNTLAALSSWDRTSPVDDRIATIFALEMKTLARDRRSGQFADQLNRYRPGMSSVVKSTARRLRNVDDQILAESGATMLRELNPSWNDLATWHSIQESGKVFSINYYLTSVDLQNIDGHISQRDIKIYVDLYIKTLKMAILITLLTIVLGYPLAFFMAHCSPGLSNILMIFVLLPFWTSLLVRTTAWIALLQTNGVANSILTTVGFTNEPIELLYSQFATIISMTHILLPFMVLPLYAVMRGIDPSYMRAAMSMGSRPLNAWCKIYLPMSLPGLSAGALLVFIISVGYYITPALVGGVDGQMISNIIAFHMQQSNNWELAAALGSLLLVLILILYWLFDKFVGAANIKLG